MEAAKRAVVTYDGRTLKALLAARDYSGLLRATEVIGTDAPPDRWLYRGKACEGLFRPTAATDCYRAGLSRWPDDVPLHLALGQLALREGDRSTALAALTRAQALDPDRLDCYAALLHLVPLDPDGPEAARILARTMDPQRSDSARARALFLYGQVQVEAGRDRTGFVYYATGNRLTAAELEQRKRRYRLPASLFRMDRTSFFAPPRGVPACPALVVTGLPRSGKSLVEGLLAEHPAVTAGGEFAGLRRALATMPARDLPSRLREAADTGRTPFADAYGQHPLAGDGSRWLVDSSPANLPRLGHFGLLHPQAPIVLCRRQAADLGLALYFKKFRSGQGYSYDLSTAGQAIARAEHLIDHWQDVLPNPVLVVDYEDLVTDPERTRARLFDHIGLTPPPRTMAPAAKEGAWRLFPSKTPGTGSALDPSLLGFADRFQRELRPLVRAYRATRATRN